MAYSTVSEMNTRVCSRPFGSQEMLHHNSASNNVFQAMNSVCIIRPKTSSAPGLQKLEFDVGRWEEAAALAQAELPALRTFIDVSRRSIHVASSSSDMKPLTLERYSSAEFRNILNNDELNVDVLVEAENNRPFRCEHFVCPVRFVFIDNRILLFTFDHRVFDGVTGLSCLRLIFANYLNVPRPSGRELEAYHTLRATSNVDRAIPRGILDKATYAVSMLEFAVRYLSLLGKNANVRSPSAGTSQSRTQRAVQLSEDSTFTTAPTSTSTATSVTEKLKEREKGITLRDIVNNRETIASECIGKQGSYSRTILFSFDTRTTLRLEQLAKQNKVTVGSALMAAIAWGIARRGNSSNRIWAQFVVDMRKFFLHKQPNFMKQSTTNPFISEGNCIGIFDCFFRIPDGTSKENRLEAFWKVAKRIKSSTHYQVKTGGFVRSMCLVKNSQWFLKNISRLPKLLRIVPTFSLPNVGLIDGQYMLPAAMKAIQSMDEGFKRRLPKPFSQFFPGDNEFRLHEFEKTAASYLQDLEYYPASTAPVAEPHLLFSTMTSSSQLRGSVCWACPQITIQVVQDIVNEFCALIREVVSKDDISSSVSSVESETSEIQ
eukprot:ANDGO_05040.mRNA.1 hypothetical protein